MRFHNTPELEWNIVQSPGMREGALLQRELVDRMRFYEEPPFSLR